MFKAQILAELIKQYPGLSKQFLGAMAEKLSAKVTDETTIEGVVTELNTGTVTITDLAAVYQQEGDRRATEAVNTYKTKNPNPADPTKPTTEPAKPKEGESDLEKEVRLMKEKLDALEREKMQSRGKEALLAKMKEAKIPERLAKRITVTDETDIDALLAELQTEYNEEKQAYTTEALRQGSFVPGGGNGGLTPDAEKGKLTDAIKNFTKNQNDSAAKTTQKV